MCNMLYFVRGKWLEFCISFLNSYFVGNSFENVWGTNGHVKINIQIAIESISLEQNMTYCTSIDWKFYLDYESFKIFIIEIQILNFRYILQINL
jgi:hypothetical protein